MTKITDEYNKEVKMFVDAMRLKLHVNRHKGKWEGKTTTELFKLLRQEVDELEDEINSEDQNQMAIILESADIAVFAMIIANVAMKTAAGDPPDVVNEVLNLSFHQAPHLNATEDEIKKALGVV